MTHGSLVERLSTGNEYVSIPEIRASKAGIEVIGFMHKGFRASIELHGSEDQPLLEPVVEVEGEDPGECNAFRFAARKCRRR